MHQVESSSGAVSGMLSLPAGSHHSWYFEKSELRQSPSFLDGINAESENRYRQEGVQFIMKVGATLGLQYHTLATGVVFFHRFYMFHSFKAFPHFVMSCCCLFLAGKAEETPKKCKDVLKVAMSYLTAAQFQQFGDDPREEIMTLERILLQTVRFDFQVDHPYTHLLKYAKCFKGDRSKREKLVQMAWTFVNDSFYTILCLEWEPEVIAIAMLYLAGKLSKFKVTDWIGKTSQQKHWWEMYVEGISVPLLEDICHQVLDLYPTLLPQNQCNSPPATPPTKSTHKPSQVALGPQTVPSPEGIQQKEVPGGIFIPRPESGDLKHKTPNSVNCDGADEKMEPTAASRRHRNSSSDMVMCYRNPSSGKSSSGKNFTPGSVINSSPRSCSTPDVEKCNGSSDTWENNNSADASNSSDVAKMSDPPDNFTKEKSEKSEMGSFIETINSRYSSHTVSSSEEYTSQNVLSTSDSVSAEPVVTTTAVTTMTATSMNVYSPYIQPSVSFENPYLPQPQLQLPQQPATFFPSQLRMGHTTSFPPQPPPSLPLPPAPNTLVPPPQLTLPHRMHFPDMFAPRHTLSLPQYHPSTLPPPQSVPAVTTPQFPPPPLHPQGPGAVANTIPQCSSKVTRPPPPLVHAPVPVAVSWPNMIQAFRPAHPSNPQPPPLLQNAPRPPLTQNAPRPPLTQNVPRPPLTQNVSCPSSQSGYHPELRTYISYPGSQNTPYPASQNIVHPASQPSPMLQNLPPVHFSVADMNAVSLSSAHYGNRPDSNPVPHPQEQRSSGSETVQAPHNIRPSISPDSREPPMHMTDRECSLSSEFDRAGPRNSYDSNGRRHFHQETDSCPAYTGMSYDRKHSNHDQNFRHRWRHNVARHRVSNRYDNLYKRNKRNISPPPHIRHRSPPSRRYRFENRGDSRNQPPSHMKAKVPNEMPRGNSN